MVVDVVHGIFTNMHIGLVPALSKKWRVACENLAPARAAFRDQDRSTDPVDSVKWRKMAEIAANERKSKPSAMDVYAVQSKKRE